ncbi:MAG: bifunctional adenosylcobinamide kinase/adenosylcobinamide-phosphate guanylyltransferase [Elusimicrobia bacterium]|nr:MAG: bifunctional adenosylcobinamide kinase/adenosylcobinamide-phosphate guanylyltransferase [Elusimicrobiota bacterium]
MRELILGGSRSGKSLLAESRATESGLRVVYVATAQPLDDEMECRIAHHQARRPSDWATVEEPVDLAAALRRYADDDVCVLVDCLTLWLSNLLLADDVGGVTGNALRRWAARRQALLDVLPRLPGKIVLVSNEVGSGIVPMTALSRAFADEQGRLNQCVAALCDRVTLVVAGLPLPLK